MRARNIKPGFFKNEELSEMSTDVRLLFIGLWCLADREGRIEDRPKRIKAELFPFDSFDVDPMLNQLQSKGLIIRYEIENKKYLSVVNFVKHQDPHYREKASELPPPPGQTDQVKATGVTRTQRERILERDGYACQHCDSKEHLCIDHILPVSRGGDSSDENLQVLCLPCNTRKGNKINGEEKNINKPNKSGHIQKFGSKSVQGRIEVRSKQSSDAPLIPDSLIPDSLIPDSLIPDSLIPDIRIPDSIKTQGAKKSKSPQLAVALIELPPFVLRDSWLGFIEMRQKIKKPPTERAAQMLVKKLINFHNRGFDVNEILDQSTVNSWQDLYEPKHNRIANHQNDRDMILAANAAACREFAGVSA